MVPSWAKYLIGYLLILLAMLGCIWGIYHCGVLDERERNAAVENIKLVEYGQRILELQTRNRVLERANVIRVNELTVNYEKRINDAENKAKSALRSVATGAVKLRIATKAGAETCRDTTAKAGATPAAATESTAELSDSAAGFLVNLANECDATAEKLNLCIDVAQTDRGHDLATAASVSSESFSSDMSTSIALTNKEIK